MIFVLFLALATLNAVISFPANNTGNPDEFGPYFEFDMRFKDGNTRNGIINQAARWPRGVVAYKFKNGFEKSKRRVVRNAMKHIQSVTSDCITFVKRSTENDFIEIFGTDSSCWSYVGKIGGKQQISYPQWCIDQFGSVQHELYHALGFFHEHSRSDRDNYVTIMWNNIQSGAASNFYSRSANEITDFGVSYDYGSVMHYSAYAASANGQKTIVTKDPNAVIGQRNGLSRKDIRKLKRMYNC